MLDLFGFITFLGFQKLDRRMVPCAAPHWAALSQCCGCRRAKDPVGSAPWSVRDCLGSQCCQASGPLDSGHSDAIPAEPLNSGFVHGWWLLMVDDLWMRSYIFTWLMYSGWWLLVVDPWWSMYFLDLHVIVYKCPVERSFSAFDRCTSVGRWRIGWTRQRK